jgi:hypothetical protein
MLREVTGRYIDTRQSPIFVDLEDYVPALIDPEKEAELPKPVRNEKNRIGIKPIYPFPFLYALTNVISSCLQMYSCYAPR